MTTKNMKVNKASDASSDAAFFNGAQVYLNKNTTWELHIIDYCSTDERGNAVIVLEDKWGYKFKLRNNGRYSCSDGTLYASTDLSAKVLYDAYQKAARTELENEAIRRERNQIRRQLNWKRQDVCKALNADKYLSVSSLDTLTTACAAVGIAYKGLNDSGEFDPDVRVVISHTTPNSNMTSVATLSIEAAEALVQQLADAVIDARTRLIPEVHILKMQFLGEDVNSGFVADASEDESN